MQVGPSLSFGVRIRRAVRVLNLARATGSEERLASIPTRLSCENYHLGRAMKRTGQLSSTVANSQ